MSPYLTVKDECLKYFLKTAAKTAKHTQTHLLINAAHRRTRTHLQGVLVFEQIKMQKIKDNFISYIYTLINNTLNLD